MIDCQNEDCPILGKKLESVETRRWRSNDHGDCLRRVLTQGRGNVPDVRAQEIYRFVILKEKAQRRLRC